MNTSPTNDPVARVLIVENESGTVQNLEHKLRRDIPKVVIESASTVVAGQEKLNAAFDYNRPFDVAILDFRLPHDQDSPVEVADFSLGFLQNAKTLIIHMAAKPDDPDFQRMRPAPNSPEAARRLYFGKEGNWAQDVADVCAKHVREKHAARIRAEFERLFQPQDEFAPAFRSTSRATSGRGDRARSLEIAAFCDDAGEHWDDLIADATLQKELSDALGHAQDTDGRHYVGVVAEYRPSSDEGKPAKP